jgi:hypothetical protein
MIENIKTIYTASQKNAGIMECLKIEENEIRNRKPL